MVNAATLLTKLPPFRDEWVMIKENQKVDEIIKQILAAHKKYAAYYDKIALYFDADTTEEICENLYNFCRKEIIYKEESEDDQTTALPAGVLTRGQGDCKHYAGFCAGVLDAIKRLTGKKINWYYRFASYNLLTKTPHHVFVVVKDKDGEIWIDPVPGANDLEPYWQVDKKINTMPLQDNIGSVHYHTGGYDHIGEVDWEKVASHAKIAFDFITSFGKTDKVPNYPVKSQNTFNSLVASIQEIIPLPPQSVADAKRLLQITYDERVKAVARGTDRATLTVIMLLDEIIVSLQNYITLKGGTVPAPGTDPLTAGNFFSNPMVIIAAVGVGIYFLTRKKKRVSGRKY